MKTTRTPLHIPNTQVEHKNLKKCKAFFLIFTKSVYYCLMLFQANLCQVSVHIVSKYLLVDY